MLNQPVRSILGTMILILILILSTSCAVKLVHIPAPAFPKMKCVKIDKDGALRGENLINAVYNSKEQQRLIDKLYECPCYKK